MPGRKVIDDTFTISRKRGDGLLPCEIWVDRHGRVARCNLAYINHAVFAGDNGRVLGSDDAHGYRHRHCMGAVGSVEFLSFEDIEARFESEWVAIAGER